MMHPVNVHFSHLVIRNGCLRDQHNMLTLMKLANVTNLLAMSKTIEVRSVRRSERGDCINFCHNNGCVC